MAMIFKKIVAIGRLLLKHPNPFWKDWDAILII